MISVIGNVPLFFSGASTFPGLRKFIVDQSNTRVRCLLHIALHGLAASGCAGGGNDSFRAFGLRYDNLTWDVETAFCKAKKGVR